MAAVSDWRGVLALLALLPLLLGCAVEDPARRAARADRLATEQGWHRQLFRVPPFALLGYASPGGPGTGDTLAVYIEGDGLAWEGRSEPSTDPTPIVPTGLQLALQDPSRFRLYLARPCQYLSPADLAACNPDYWLARRFAPEVIAALDQAIDRQKAAVGARHVSLFGWSGGGAAAALVAARRQDVTLLVTAAANLDTAAWTRIKDVSPLAGSLNPAEQAARLQDIPQVHFTGRDDQVVPPAVLDAFLARMADRRRVTRVALAGFDHKCCWARDWPDLLRRYVYP